MITNFRYSFYRPDAVYSTYFKNFRKAGHHFENLVVIIIRIHTEWNIIRAKIIPRNWARDQTSPTERETETKITEALGK